MNFESKQNSPLSAKEKKSQFVQHGFSEIAPVYDKFNHIITFGLHKYWKRKVAQAVLKENPQKILDACCGTGDIAQETALIAAKKPQSPEIIGFDFSSDMLAFANRRNKYPDMVGYAEGDINDSKFPAQYFDAVSMGFGLRNVSHIPTCLCELNRIMTSNGLLVILDVGKINIPVIRSLYHLYFFRIVPLIGALLLKKTDMFGYFPKSTVDYPDAASLKCLLAEHGFGDTTIHKFSLGSITIHVSRKTNEYKTLDNDGNDDSGN